jgi:hypothetical protein
MRLQHWIILLMGLLGGGAASVAHADALSELAGQKDLTPEKLIRSFSGFTFELNAQPQAPETFLLRKRGDCDDFATLASRILSERGYQTKLVVVMMHEQTHVVCYVKEAGGFLDFNHRADARPIMESDGSLEDIARKVSGDFRAPWQMVSEVKYEKQQMVYLDNAFPALAQSAPVAGRLTAEIKAKDEGTRSSSVLLTSLSTKGSNDLARIERRR